MKYDALLLWIFCIFIVSCHRNQSERTSSPQMLRDSFLLPEPESPTDMYLTPALQECIRCYRPFRNERDMVYYHVYFFRKDSVDYFTIFYGWADWLNVIEKHTPGVHYDYYWFEFLGNDVFFIKRHDAKGSFPFTPCIHPLSSEVTNCIPHKIAMLYNEFGFRTFRYDFDGEKYHIGGLRDTIYMGFPCYEFLIHGEMRYLKRENELLDLDPDILYPVY